MRRKAARAAHVRLVARTRREIGRSFSAVLRGQLEAVAAAFPDANLGVVELLRSPEQQEALDRAMTPVLAKAMIRGAATELKNLPEIKTTAQDLADRLLLDVPEQIALQLPDWLVAFIERELAETFRADFWRRINWRTADDVQEILLEAIEAGLSIRRIQKRIWEARGEYTEARAYAVARTETTRALNAGHLEGMRGLEIETGFRVKKEWLSVQGSTTRPTHAAADGQQRELDEPFDLGGYPAMYPGDRELPPGEVIHCQCTVISAFEGEQL